MKAEGKEKSVGEKKNFYFFRTCVFIKSGVVHSGVTQCPLLNEEKNSCFSQQVCNVPTYFRLSLLPQVMCYLVPFIELSVSHASVLTILAITVERYYAICLPLQVCSAGRKTDGKKVKSSAFFLGNDVM